MFQRPIIVFAAGVLIAAAMAPVSRAADRAGRAAGFATDNRPTAASGRVDELIRQLGSPQYTVRRTAANELHAIGPEAFDQLHAATGDADPEIAASARYLLQQITVRWTRSDDSATVRRLLQDYSGLEDVRRHHVIRQLGDLPQREGIAALCRIARFDRSPRLSRLAALAAMRIVERDESDRSVDPEIIARELGPSTRVAAEWLRQYQLQLRDPAASVAGWQALVDAESRRLGANDDETSSAIVLALLWNLADVHRRLGETVPLVAVSDQIISVSGDSSDLVMAKFLQWLIDHDTWDALDQFSAKHDARIRQTKLALYLMALARSKQGQSEQADKLADEASRLAMRPGVDPLQATAEQAQLAQLVAEWGQFDWAVREHRRVIDDRPLESPESLAGRVLLSNLLYDYERYRESAEVIEPLANSLPKDRQLQRTYNELQEELAAYDQFLLSAEGIGARRHFMLACNYEREGQYDKQHEHLRKAIEHDEEDADVLIAMFRAPEADEAWRADTRQRIDKLARSTEGKIEDDPNNPVWYNQWAWLVANTEGDHEKAVRYSRRSLELLRELPEELNTKGRRASFLDTLGRCYYAVGDYEKAIQRQREAVALIPHMQVMQRQLALFEKALAEKERTDAAPSSR